MRSVWVGLLAAGQDGEAVGRQGPVTTGRAQGTQERGLVYRLQPHRPVRATAYLLWLYVQGLVLTEP